MEDTVVELEGVNGEWFTLAGPNEGDRGVYLGTGIEGCFYDPPVKTVYEEPGNWPGARYLSHRILRRDIVFGVEILNDKGSNSWLSRDSEWRKAWAFDRDCKLHVTTPESGTRTLKLRLLESPSMKMDTDPRKKGVNRCDMVCVAGDPFWYAEDEVYDAVTATDTRFNPNPLPWPWPKESLPTETLYITVDPSDGRGGLNPTDNYVFPKWTVPGSTEKPAEPYVPGLPWLGAPKSQATIWTLPDYSFEDDEYANRRVRLPGLIGGLRTREIQAFALDGRPNGGSYTITWNDGDVNETVGPINWNANTSTLEAALTAFSKVTLGDVSVSRANSTNEIQQWKITGATGGTYSITFEGQTTTGISLGASAESVRTALARINGISYWDIDIDVNGQNEVQYVYLVGEPTAGQFRLTFDGQQTSLINWNASAKTVENALKALNNIGSSDVKVTKKAGAYQPWKVEFRGGLTGVNLVPLGYNLGTLSGGFGIDMMVKTEQEGDRVYTIKFNSPYWFGAGNWAGVNLPPLQINTGGLTGPAPIAEVIPVQDGMKPYVIEFRGTLEGAEDIPLLTVDASNVTGHQGTGTARTWLLRKGVTYPGEDAVIDTDPRVEQVVSSNGSELWARMNGVRFRHYIPPYTPSKTFEITVSGAPPGEMVTLRLTRAWTRPWGLE